MRPDRPMAAVGEKIRPARCPPPPVAVYLLRVLTA